jgi:hypothetical protein
VEQKLQDQTLSNYLEQKKGNAVCALGGMVKEKDPGQCVESVAKDFTLAVFGSIHAAGSW